MNNIKTISKMRGILIRKFGEVDVLGVENSLEVPKIQDKQVLIKVHSSGVNPVDTYLRSGVYPKLPSLPYTPGKEGAGIVHQIGNGVTKFKVGDRVFCCGNTERGTLGEFTAMDEENVYPLGPQLSFNQGAAISIAYFTAFRALMLKGEAKSGNKILVHGASGAVGLAAVQLAKANGMVVSGTAGTDEGINIVKSNGADVVYNHRDSNYLNQLKIGEKFDVILEMLSNVNLQNDLSLMAPRGRTVVVGCRGEIQINPRLLMTSETSVIGCQLFASTKEEWNVTTAAIIEGISKGWVNPVVAKTYSLDQVGQAHHDIIQSSGAKGKLVVEI